MTASLLTLSQAADQLGRVTAQTLKVQAQRGRLRAEKLGRDWLVAPAEVERYRREVLRPTSTATADLAQKSDLSDSDSAQMSDLVDSVSPQMSDLRDSDSRFGRPRPAPKPAKKRR